MSSFNQRSRTPPPSQNPPLTKADYNRSCRIEEDFRIKYKDEDSKYGNVTVIETGPEGRILDAREKITQNKREHNNNIHNAKQRLRMNHPNLQKMHDFSTGTNSKMCSTFHRVREYWDHSEQNLEKECYNQEKNWQGYTDEELTHMVAKLTRGLSHLHKNNRIHCEISPKYVDVGLPNSCQYKLLEPARVNHGHIAVCQRDVLDGRDIYVAPEVFEQTRMVKNNSRSKRIEPNQQPRQTGPVTPEKADAFALGMTILRAGVGESVQDCYNTNNSNFNNEALNNHLKNFEDKYGHNQMLIDSVDNLLDLNPQTRWTPSELEEVLPSERETDDYFGNRSIAPMNTAPNTRNRNSNPRNRNPNRRNGNSNPRNKRKKRPRNQKLSPTKSRASNRPSNRSLDRRSNHPSNRSINRPNNHPLDRSLSRDSYPSNRSSVRSRSPQKYANPRRPGEVYKPLFGPGEFWEPSDKMKAKLQQNNRSIDPAIRHPNAPRVHPGVRHNIPGQRINPRNQSTGPSIINRPIANSGVYDSNRPYPGNGAQPRAVTPIMRRGSIAPNNPNYASNYPSTHRSSIEPFNPRQSAVAVQPISNFRDSRIGGKPVSNFAPGRVPNQQGYPLGVNRIPIQPNQNQIGIRTPGQPIHKQMGTRVPAQPIYNLGAGKRIPGQPNQNNIGPRVQGQPIHNPAGSRLPAQSGLGRRTQPISQPIGGNRRNISRDSIGSTGISRDSTNYASGAVPRYSNVQNSNGPSRIRNPASANQHIVSNNGLRPASRSNEILIEDIGNSSTRGQPARRVQI